MVYQPKGRTVGLSGGPQSVGFQPVKAADYTSVVNQAGQQRLDNFNRASEAYIDQKTDNVQALAQFSETLNKFIFDQAKTHNENEFKLGLASVLNGELKPKEELAQEYQNKAVELREGVDVEYKVIDKVAEESPGAALQRRQDSPAIKGWRAYGQAVGKAKMAGAAANAVMGQLMSGTEPTVPIIENGQVRMMAPADARTPAEFKAAWAFNTQVFIDQAGLVGLNPIIIAEEVTPQMMNAQTNLFAQRMAEALKLSQEENLQTARINAIQASDTMDFTNPEEVQISWQTVSSDFARGTGLSRGQANDKAAETLIERAIVTKNRDMLDALSQTPLLANQPNGITVGEYYSPLFKQAYEKIDDDIRREEQIREAELADELEGMENARLQGIMQARTPEEAAQVNEAYMAGLQRLSDSGSLEASKKLLEMQTQDANYSPMRAKDIRDQLRKDPTSVTEAQLMEELRRGYITAEEARSLKDLLPTNIAAEQAEEFEKEVDSIAKATLRQKSTEAGIVVSADGASLLAGMEGHFKEELLGLLKGFFAENPGASTAQARDFLNLKSRELAEQPRYKITKDEKGRPRLPQLSSQPIRELKNPVDGRTTRVMTNASPAQITAARPRINQDTLLTRAEVEQGVEDFVAGRPPSNRVRQIMQATGASQEALLRNQSIVQGVTLPSGFSNSPGARASRERGLLAPSSNTILNNPNSSPLQRLRAYENMALAKQRKANQQSQLPDTSGGPDLAPGVQVSADDLARLGYNQGLRGNDLVKFVAVGLGESGGRSGVVRDRPDTGDLSYGLYQINMMGDMGPERQRKYGLKSYDDLKDPETNVRIAAEMWKSGGPTAWGAYNNGSYRTHIPEASRAVSNLTRNLAAGGGNFNSAGRGGVRLANMTPKNVTSVTYDTGQPGIDVYFEDKNFGAVLPGRVKEISNQTGPGNTGYGNFIVVESIDPATGGKVDVLYAHLDRVDVREGQSIRPGQVIGRQGGTGRVVSVDGTIASIDFLAPAPKGSKSMVPYRDYDRLRRRIGSQLQSGQFR